MRKGLGILSMQASLTLNEIVEARREEIVALFSAEHGFFGSAAAGEKTGNQVHPYYNLPIRSLYGDHRRPTDEMMADISEMIIDLVDIGVRCYTYLATMKLMLEVCAEKGIPVTVIDHPIPLHGKVDGPRREDKWSSFVAPIDVPLLHGMTPGEAAKHIVQGLKVRAEGFDFKVIPFPQPIPSTFNLQPSTLNFIPPSPAIRSVDSAALYPMLVWSEAYPKVDIDRNGPLAFRMVSAPFIDVKSLVEDCRVLSKYGVKAHPFGKGVLFTITDIELFKPVSAGVKLLEILLKRYPKEMLEGVRREWMNKLYGTEKVQAAVEEGAADKEIERWQNT